jgi:hypothetical protein
MGSLLNNILKVYEYWEINIINTKLTKYCFQNSYFLKNILQLLIIIILVNQYLNMITFTKEKITKTAYAD